MLPGACGHPLEPAPALPAPAVPAAHSGAQSIGMAEMLSDRTIILQLRAEGPSGAMGDGRLVYPAGHDRYAEVLKHLGGLKPGEKKPVAPWPE
jgi:hypothetical protein